MGACCLCVNFTTTVSLTVVSIFVALNHRDELLTKAYSTTKLGRLLNGCSDQYTEINYDEITRDLDQADSNSQLIIVFATISAGIACFLLMYAVGMCLCMK